MPLLEAQDAKSIDCIFPRLVFLFPVYVPWRITTILLRGFGHDRCVYFNGSVFLYLPVLPVSWQSRCFSQGLAHHVGTGCRTSLVAYPYGFDGAFRIDLGPGPWNFGFLLRGHISGRICGVQGSTQEEKMTTNFKESIDYESAGRGFKFLWAYQRNSFEFNNFTWFRSSILIL